MASNKIWGWTIHGVSNSGKWTTSEEEYFTECPFCQAEEKFYINPVKMVFDCKVCNLQGNYLTFLKEIHKLNLTFLKDYLLTGLAEERKIPLTALEGMEIGWNGERFTFPVYDVEGEMVGLDLYKAGEKIMHSPKPAKISLWNAPKLKEHINGPIIICEGMWDGLALQYLLNELKVKATVVAVPGCQTKIDPWIVYLENKHVTLLYDNDQPGVLGEFKVYQSLDKISETLKFLHWPEGKPLGYDIRDHFAKWVVKNGNPQKCWKLILHWLQEIPRHLGNMTRHPDGKTFLEQRKEKLDPISFQELMKVCREYLYFRIDDPVRILLGVIYANRFRGDMVWMFLVAPPSCGKSELILSLNNCKAEVEHVTTVTENTFISGYLGTGSDVSLLNKLRNRMLAVKDFTPLLKLIGPVQQKVFGTLRDAYDGSIDAMYGHGQNRRFEGLHFGIIAGVTPEIEMLAKMQVSLGERFLRYNFPINTIDQENINKKAEGNIGFEKQRKAAFAHAVYRFLETNKGFDVPKRSPEISTQIRNLAEFLALMRSVVPRDFKERVQYSPMKEGSARLNKQLNYLAMGLACLERKSEIGKEEIRLIKDVVISTCPDIVQKTVRVFWDNGKLPLALYDLSVRTNFPIGTLKFIMDDLTMLGITITINSAVKKFYTLTDRAKGIIAASEIYSSEKPKLT